MKRLSYKNTQQLLWFCFVITFTFMMGCKEDEPMTPVITEIRNYAATPNDTLVKQIIPGQWVVLTGSNLKNAVQITFDGVPITFNHAMFADNYAVVQLPSIIPFPSVPASELNVIRYKTTEGETAFNFNIVAPAPTISSISNEMANVGDSTFIYGLNLFLLKEVKFGGVSITNYTTSNDGTSIRFVMPTITQSGPVIVTTQSGTATTTFNVGKQNDGVVCNFDDINSMSWGCGTSNNASNYPGNRGYYAVLNTGTLNGGDNAWWNWERGINTNSVKWLPKENLTQPIENYAVKFEINIPKDWKSTALYILKDYSWNYIARYEPWKNTDGSATAYKTDGWRTVTIPFTAFRKDNGKGIGASNLADILGTSGEGSFHIYTINDLNTTSSGLTAAVDNIRIVKIK